MLKHESAVKSALIRVYHRTALVVASIATIVLYPGESPFPIPYPKIAVLAVGAWILWAIALLSRGIPGESREDTDGIRIFRGALGFMVFSICLRAILQKPSHIALWGITGRLIAGLLYVSLAMLALSVLGRVAKTFTARVLHNGLLITGAITATYGVMELLGRGFIVWTLPGPVSTLANIDHTSAWHAIVAIACLGALLQKDRSYINRTLVSGILVCSIWVIWHLYRHFRIDQGVIFGTIGALALLTNIWRRRVKRSFEASWQWIVGIAFMLALFVYAVVRVLPSNGFRDRLYLWQDAYHMLRMHPFAGVGLGRFGAMYYQVQSLAEARAVGPWLYCDDAHSVLFQIAATGGLLVAIPYLAIMGTALYAAIQTIITSRETLDDANVVIAIIATMYWLQASISPEMSAIAVWGWLASALTVRNYFIAAKTKSPSHSALLEVRPRWRVPSLICPALQILITGSVGVVGGVALFSQGKTEIEIAKIKNWVNRQTFRNESRLSQSVRRVERRNLAYRIVQARPGDEVAAKAAMDFLALSGDIRGAVAMGENELKHEQDNPQLVIGLVDLYNEIGDQKRTHALLQEATQRQPNNPYLWYARGYAAAARADTTDALSSWIRAAKLDSLVKDESGLSARMKERGVSNFPWLVRAKGAQ